MSGRIAIVDYGAGNMFSIEHALRSIGADVVVISEAEQYARLEPESLVLPGVGAYGKGMQALSDRGLDVLLTEHSSAGRPLLGICLGAQLLLSESSEFGNHAGLGLVDGAAVPFNRSLVRVPHIGWGRLDGGGRWNSPLFADVPENSWMYFVHSFFLSPAHQEDVLCSTSLGPLSFTSAVHRGSTFGVQFHPEKSGPLGLRILHNFINLKAST